MELFGFRPAHDAGYSIILELQTETQARPIFVFIETLLETKLQIAYKPTLRSTSLHFACMTSLSDVLIFVYCMLFYLLFNIRNERK